MFRLNFFVSLVLGVLCLQTLVEAKNIKITPRIIGGVPSTIEENKYLVQVISDTQFCGGALIHPTWVLTAAHCIKKPDVTLTSVIGGTSDMLGISGLGQRRGVVFIKKHEEYNVQAKNKDVALLKLKSALTRSTVIPLGGQVKEGWSVKISGWGLTSEDGSPSDEVRSVRLIVVPNETCRKAYAGLVPITKDMFCAAAPGKDSCTGDSGGPVIYNSKLFGVVSFGLGCARPNFPGVYVRISEVTPWIRNVIATN